MSNRTYETCLFLTIEDVSGKPLIKFTAIATSVIGLLSSFGSIFGNALVIYVIAKFSRLQNPSNILIANLCITDFMTGFIVVPTISIRRITEAYGNGICAVRIICAYFAYLTVIVSIVTVCMISVDRYFAIMRPFLYQRTISISRYLIIVSFLWLVQGIYSGLPFLRVLSGSTYFKIAFMLMTATIVVFLISYVRISIVARYHRRRLQPSINSSQKNVTLPPTMRQGDEHGPAMEVSSWTKVGASNVGECMARLDAIGTSETKPFDGARAKTFHAQELLEKSPHYSELKFGSTAECKDFRRHDACNDAANPSSRDRNCLETMQAPDQKTESSKHKLTGHVAASLQYKKSDKLSLNHIMVNDNASEQKNEMKIRRGCKISPAEEFEGEIIYKAPENHKAHTNCTGSCRDCQGYEPKHQTDNELDSIVVNEKRLSTINPTIKRATRQRAVNAASKSKYNINRGEQKRANTIAILVFVAVICYGPLAIIYVLRAIYGDTFELIYIADPWADLILYINSAINPIIYCLRGKEFRDAVKKVLPNGLLKLFGCGRPGGEV